MDNFSEALQHLRDTHDKEVEALLLQVDELRGRCLAKEKEVERLMEECERKDRILQRFTERKEQQLVQLKKKLLQRNETILTLRGMRPAGVDPAVSIANDAAHTGSLSLLASSTPSRLTTEQTESLTPHSTEDSSPTSNGTGAMSSQGVSIPAGVDEEKVKMEEGAPVVGFGRSASSVEACSPSLLDSSTSETKSLISPQSQENEGGISETIFSPSLLNCEERILQHSTQMDLAKGAIILHSASDTSTETSHTTAGSSELSLNDPVTKLASRSDQAPPALGVPPSDTQYLLHSINTFPMSPEIGMGSRKDLSISLDESNDCQLEDGSRNKTEESTYLEGEAMCVHHRRAGSAVASNSTGAGLLSKEEERMGRTKRLALQKGKSIRRPKQKTLTQTFLTVGLDKANPEHWRDKSPLKGKEHTVGRKKCAGEDEPAGMLTSSLRAWKTGSQEQPLPSNATTPKKMQTIPKTTPSPIAPKFRKVVTVVPQTPLPCTSPSASKVSPRGWTQRKKNEGRHAEPMKWDPEETYLPLSQLNRSGSREGVVEEELSDPNNVAERVGREQFRLSIQLFSTSEFSTKSDNSAAHAQHTMAQTYASRTVGASDGAHPSQKRMCDEGNFNSSVSDVSPPAKLRVVEVQEDVDPPSFPQNKDAVIRRLGLPTGYKCSVPVRRQEDRRHLDARACQQCELWYKDNPERMKQSCRHKELHLHSDTPADFFRLDFTPTQDDSQQP